MWSHTRRISCVISWPGGSLSTIVSAPFLVACFLLLTLEVTVQNAITAEGAAVLGALLRDVHSLQHLNIGNNRINEEGTE